LQPNPDTKAVHAALPREILKNRQKAVTEQAPLN
jgi:hypothetical protein